MNFIRFDPQTGTILQMGWMAAEFVEKEISDGLPIIPAPDYVDWSKSRVNLQTRQIEEIPHEEAIQQ